MLRMALMSANVSLMDESHSVQSLWPKIMSLSGLDTSRGNSAVCMPLSSVAGMRTMILIWNMPIFLVGTKLERSLQFLGFGLMSGDTPSDPFLSSSAATHRFPMLDPHRTSLSDLGPYRTYHGLHHITSYLHIYYVPMFLDLAYV